MTGNARHELDILIEQSIHDGPRDIIDELCYGTNFGHLSHDEAIILMQHLENEGMRSCVVKSDLQEIIVACEHVEVVERATKWLSEISDLHPDLFSTDPQILLKI
jgi:hypothetical protein